MSVIAHDVVVKHSQSDVLENLEAFLWADSANQAGDGTPGLTTAVQRVNRTTFKETERIDLLLFTQDVVTKYVVKADPQGARISISSEVNGLIGGVLDLADALGGEEMSTEAQFNQWATRLGGYITQQKQAGRSQKGVS